MEYFRDIISNKSEFNRMFTTTSILNLIITHSLFRRLCPEPHEVVLLHHPRGVGKNGLVGFDTRGVSTKPPEVFGAKMNRDSVISDNVGAVLVA